MASVVPTTPTTSIHVPGRITFGTSPDIPAKIPSPHPIGAVSFSIFVIDWKETPTHHVFKMDVPGLKKHQLKVQIEDGRVLRICGEKKPDPRQDTDTWHCYERCPGKCDRDFTLPTKVNVDDIKAAMEDGVLTVTVPKVESHEKTVIKAIDIAA
ncbi:18.1 kDa class I heat shock protein-like [Abrus precatorius]|uniref:18.1 kDa class I heat shock protein-like n=1 Tax=Abrus precatorius TaxID=3816 RepID=A0A8B8MMP0_ABRPR|nr:18.1 kDa class I heat shock protein-like [Abrus precatorius]